MDQSKRTLNYHPWLQLANVNVCLHSLMFN